MEVLDGQPPTGPWGRRSSEDPGASSCAPWAWEPPARAQVCPGGGSGVPGAGSGVSLVSSQGALGKHSGVWLPVSLLPGTRAGQEGPACGPAEPAVDGPEAAVTSAPAETRAHLLSGVSASLPASAGRPAPQLAGGATSCRKIPCRGSSPGRDPLRGGSTHGLVPTRWPVPRAAVSGLQPGAGEAQQMAGWGPWRGTGRWGRPPEGLGHGRLLGAWCPPSAPDTQRRAAESGRGGWIRSLCSRAQGLRHRCRQNDEKE